MPSETRSLTCGFLLALLFAAYPTSASGAERADAHLAGVELAESITQLTGVAISPMLGVSALGAWHYYRANEEDRGRLPWFCHPYVWGLGLALLGLCFMKDAVGTAAPPLLKKPLDVVELFENKLSAVVACSTVVPFVLSDIDVAQLSASLASSPPVVAAASGFALSDIDIRLAFIPVAVAGFLVVWLACHAINVLIALCPFGLIDGILKMLKGGLLALVIVSALVNPYLGAVVSLGLVFVACLIAPWAFRLLIFGVVFGLDVLWPARGRRQIRASEPHAFLARSVQSTPVRTYGRLRQTPEGAVVFTFRPWLVFASRSVRIPDGDLSVSKGLLFPSLAWQPPGAKVARTVVILLPRYRSCETMVAESLGDIRVQDGRLVRGIAAARAWVVDTFGAITDEVNWRFRARSS